MPGLNFQKRFAPKVESGDKLQTIRAYRKDGRDPKVGQWLYFFAGQRTKKCRRLGKAICTSVQPVVLDAWPTIVDGPDDGDVHGERPLHPRFNIGLDWIVSLRRCNSLARRDGFADADEMCAFFAKTHGLPFGGLLIRWDKLEASNGDG